MSRNNKTYLEWVAEYPNYVVIRLEGYFYTVNYEAAELIGDICNYNIGTSTHCGNATRGYIYKRRQHKD